MFIDLRPAAPLECAVLHGAGGGNPQKLHTQRGGGARGGAWPRIREEFVGVEWMPRPV